MVRTTEVAQQKKQLVFHDCQTQHPLETSYQTTLLLKDSRYDEVLESENKAWQGRDALVESARSEAGMVPIFSILPCSRSQKVRNSL